ncbi:MAG: hypothetical protein HY538_02465 [Deltaproteobacteria bacterium]|nr:hypothetical protein [Deltaproteobacteria bacterium]
MEGGHRCVTSVESENELTTNGQATGYCPLHEDKNPSFSCNVELGVWMCHGCEAKGNVFQLTKLLGVGVQDPLPNRCATASSPIKPNFNNHLEQASLDASGCTFPIRRSAVQL